MTHMTCMHMSLEETMPQSQVCVSLISTNLILPPSSSLNTFLVGPASYICVNVTDFVRLAIESDFWNTLLLPFLFSEGSLSSLVSTCFHISNRPLPFQLHLHEISNYLDSET